MKPILLIEDDLTYSKITQNFLEKNGYEVFTAQKIKEGIRLLESKSPQLVITDYRLPDGTGMEVLEKVIQHDKQLPVIMITSYSDIRIAVRSMKMGAFEYISKPIQADELLTTIKEAFAKKGAATASGHSQPSKAQPQVPSDIPYISGTSPASQQLEKHIELVAPTDMSVIVLGESGTGKEYVAQRIHQKSNRKDAPFIAIDCGTLSQELAGSELFGHVKGAFTGALHHKTGHFEEAQHGTVFLDEIGNLSYEVQVQLLRAIQERKIRRVGGDKDIPIDVRIIVATNEDLTQAAREGRFREDLYHRLNEFSFEIQPLRKRTEDLFYFAEVFLQNSNRSLSKNVEGFSEEVKTIFSTYAWPGNLRELKNIVKRAVLLTGEGIIQKDALPIELSLPENKTDANDTQDMKSNFELQEQRMILETLEEVRHNKSKAAKRLNIDRKTLYNKMRKYGIE